MWFLDEEFRNVNPIDTIVNDKSPSEQREWEKIIIYKNKSIPLHKGQF